MPKYKVTFYTNIYVDKIIEADNIDEAEKLAWDIDEEDLEDNAVEHLDLNPNEWEILNIDEE